MEWVVAWAALRRRHMGVAIWVLRMVVLHMVVLVLLWVVPMRWEARMEVVVAMEVEGTKF